jgi:hypothetical protein
MIRVICPHCSAKLDAKDELLGQTRKCPRCGKPVVIRPAESKSPPGITPSGPTSPDRSSQLPAPPPDAPQSPPEGLLRLSRTNFYLICDPSRIIATWENNGQGWRIRTEHGFASAARNPEKIPGQGDFKLVELRMDQRGGEMQLRGLRVYQLAKRWALNGLGRGDDVVCKSITGPGSLFRIQKNAVRAQLQERFMREVWGSATDVLDYLSNDDYHSPGAGE